MVSTGFGVVALTGLQSRAKLTVVPLQALLLAKMAIVQAIALACPAAVESQKPALTEYASRRCICQGP